MLDLIRNFEFWVAMTFAILIKLRASPTITVVGSVVTTIAAIAGALVFTDPVISYLELGTQFRVPVAALLALTSEHLARMVLNTSVADIINIWRPK